MKLLFDIGGTKTRVCLGSGKRLLKKSLLILPTPPKFSAAQELFRSIRRRFQDDKIEKVVAGVAGSFDRKRTKLIHSPHLPGWVNKPLKRELSRIFAAEAILANDAELEGLGEAVLGAGRGYEVAAYLTIGTGVGGTRIVKGKVADNGFGFEPGHQLLGLPPQVKYWEDLVSGSAVLRRYRKIGSQLSAAEKKELISVLAQGLHNLIVFWSPEVIVFGGGLIEDNVYPLDQIKRRLKKAQAIFGRLPRLKKASLGELSGLYGGLLAG